MVLFAIVGELGAGKTLFCRKARQLESFACLPDMEWNLGLT